MEKFETKFGLARLVWMAPGEQPASAPPPAPTTAPASAEAPAPKDPDQVEAPAETGAEQGDKGAAASAAEQQAAREAAAAERRAREEPVRAADAAAADRMLIAAGLSEQGSEYDPIGLKRFFGEHKAEVQDILASTSAEEIQRKMQEFAKKYGPEFKKIEGQILQAFNFTEKDKEDFLKKYSTDGHLNLKEIKTAFEKKELQPKEAVILLYVTTDSDIDAMVGEWGGIEQKDADLLKNAMPSIREGIDRIREEALKPKGKAADQGDSADAGETGTEADAGQQYTDPQVESFLKENPDLQAAYGEYLSGQLTAPDFMKKAQNDPIKRGVLKQLTRPIASEERRALTTKLKGALILSPAEIKIKVNSGELTFREGIIVMESLTEQDIETLIPQERMTRAEADVFLKALSSRESASEMGNAIAEGGLIGVIKKIADAIQKLIELIGGYAESMFEKFNPKFKNSPIGGQKFGLKINKDGGYDLTPAAPGPVNWMGDKPGKVLEVDGDKITVGFGESKIIYTGVKDPQCVTDEKLNPGDKMGDMSGAYLTVQMVDKDGKEEDLESLLRDFTTTEKKPKAAAETAAAQFEIKASPIKGADKVEAESVGKEIKIKAAKGAIAQAISVGKVESADENGVKIKCAGNVTILITGVTKDSLKIQAGQDLADGAELGQVGDTGLTIKITKGSEDMDASGAMQTYIKGPETAPTDKEPSPAPTDEQAKEKARTLQELQAKQVQAINEGLKTYQNKKTVLATTPFKLNVPFIENGKLSAPVECSVNGNDEILLGTTPPLKYKMKLPLTFSLEAVEIEGNAETGSAKLTAGNFLFSTAKKVSIAKMVEFINALQKDKPDEQKLVTNDGYEVTFTKVTA